MTSNKEILVTGGAGYIGSHTVVELVNAGYSPIIIDDFRNSKEWIVERIERLVGTSVTVYKVDCCDENELRSVLKKHPDLTGAIHFARIRLSVNQC